MELERVMERGLVFLALCSGLLCLKLALSLPARFQYQGTFKDTLKKVHNEHRKAGAMKEINWDDGLDKSAQVL